MFDRKRPSHPASICTESIFILYMTFTSQDNDWFSCADVVQTFISDWTRLKAHSGHTAMLKEIKKGGKKKRLSDFGCVTRLTSDYTL